jgi:hypothetical protein
MFQARHPHGFASGVRNIATTLTGGERGGVGALGAPITEWASRRQEGDRLIRSAFDEGSLADDCAIGEPGRPS